MSKNRCSSRSFKPTDDEINKLVLKLQALLPILDHQTPQSTRTVPSATKVLEETCSYIKRLSREVDSLSERLSKLLLSADIEDADQLVTMILNR